MSRPRAGAELSLVQLEQILGDRRRQISRLERERSKLMKKVDALDEEIRDLGGDGRARGGRVRNEISLNEAMAKVLRDAGQAMKVADIVEAVLQTGYKTNSANFRGIVNQQLIKDKRFTSAARGLYQMKK